MKERAQQWIAAAMERFGAGEIALPDLLCREALTLDPGNSTALNLLGRVATALGEHGTAARLFREALTADPYFKPASKNLKAAEKAEEESRRQSAEAGREPGRERYLLIKAWGCGFWSDVDHVLAMLLLAEATGRTPVVHWGKNSRFREAATDNAFHLYFEPASERRLADVLGRGFSFFPPKWSEGNIHEERLNLWHGADSRVYGPTLLNRPEDVVVSDFHTGIVSILPWLRPEHPLFGRGVEEVYRAMMKRYLRPRGEIMDEVEAFAREKMGQDPLIAAHVRGSDKFVEEPEVFEFSRRYPEVIARMGERLGEHRVFLLTDSDTEAKAYEARYGDRLIRTDCARTSGPTGLHFLATTDRRRLGVEVMKDVHLAARCRCFVGLGASSVTCMILHLKEWREEDVHVFGRNMHHAIKVGMHIPSFAPGP